MEVINNKNGFDYVIAIGASTGGKDAINKVLKSLNKGSPPVLVAQHMAPGFTDSYVKHLKEIFLWMSSSPMTELN